MKTVILDDYITLSKTAAGIITGAMLCDKRVNLSLTTGASPIGTYEVLAPFALKNKEYLSNVHYYNFDNCPDETDPDGYMAREFKKMYLEPAGVAPANFHLLTTDNYTSFDDQIQKDGGLDLMLLGLGADGHFCANMPYATNFSSSTYSIPLKPEYPWYEGVKASMGGKMPSAVVTMGPASVMKAKHVVMIVNGASKAAAVKQLMASAVDTAFPSSILKLHPNFTLLLDKDAASML